MRLRRRWPRAATHPCRIQTSTPWDSDPVTPPSACSPGLASGPRALCRASPTSWGFNCSIASKHSRCVPGHYPESQGGGTRWRWMWDGTRNGGSFWGLKSHSVLRQWRCCHDRTAFMLIFFLPFFPAPLLTPLQLEQLSSDFLAWWFTEGLILSSLSLSVSIYKMGLLTV